MGNQGLESSARRDAGRRSSVARSRCTSLGENRKRIEAFEQIREALVSLTSVVVVAAILEVGLRLIVPDPSGYLRPPNTHSRTRPDDEHTPGIRGVADFTTNEWGLRGPSVKLMSGEPDVLRIITIGGSTTVSEFLDDSEEWSNLVMQDLNYRQDKKFVFVANAGFNGHNTADHMELLKRFPVMMNADILVFLIGINDFMTTVAFEGRATHGELVARASSESFIQPQRYPFYTRSRVYALADSLRPLVGLSRPTTAAEWYTERRRIRAQAPVVPMPDLTLGLQEYQTRIRHLAEHCRSAGKRCVFLTQPTMWRSDLTREEERLLFYGWTGTMEIPKALSEPSNSPRE